MSKPLTPDEEARVKEILETFLAKLGARTDATPLDERRVQEIVRGQMDKRFGPQDLRYAPHSLELDSPILTAAQQYEVRALAMAAIASVLCRTSEERDEVFLELTRRAHALADQAVADANVLMSREWPRG